MKKILKIIIVFMIIAGLGFLGFYFFGNKDGGNFGNNEGTSFPDFFPFGGNSQSEEPEKENPTTETPENTNTPQTETVSNNKLKKLVSKPVVGYTYVTALREKISNQEEESVDEEDNFESVDTLRYVDGETGNIYEIFLDTLQTRRLTNTTIPRVQEAFFSNSGKTVILRYLEQDGRTINTYVANVPEVTPGGDGEGKLSGKFLERGIRDLTISPDSTKIFYTIPFSGGLAGILADFDGGKPSQIFSSPFISWLPYFASNKTVELTVKATGYAKGYTYALDIGTKTMKRVLGNITGLVSKISPDGKNAVYSNSAERTAFLRILNIGDFSSSQTNLRTIPDKCSFGVKTGYLYCGVPAYFPDGIYPDAWYQGKITFTDAIWRIDPSGKIIQTELTNPERVLGDAVDAINISVDPNENHLFFVNKKDGSLFYYQLQVN